MPPIRGKSQEKITVFPSYVIKKNCRKLDMLFAQQLAILFSMHLYVLVTLISCLIAQTHLCFIIRNESLHFISKNHQF